MAIRKINPTTPWQRGMTKSDYQEVTTSTPEKSLLKSLNVNGKVLVVADFKAEENKNLELSARNIPSVKLLLPTNLNVKDLLEADFVVMTESAVNEITERLQ